MGGEISEVDLDGEMRRMQTWAGKPLTSIVVGDKLSASAIAVVKAKAASAASSCPETSAATGARRPETVEDTDMKLLAGEPGEFVVYIPWESSGSPSLRSDSGETTLSTSSNESSSGCWANGGCGSCASAWTATGEPGESDGASTSAKAGSEWSSVLSSEGQA